MEYPERTYITLWGGYWDNTSVLTYLPFGDQAESTVITNPAISWVCPANAKATVEVVSLYVSDTTAGSTVVGVHKDENETPMATDTQTVPSKTVTKFSFGSDAAVSDGEILHLSVDFTGPPDFVHWTARVRVDWR